MSMPQVGEALLCDSQASPATEQQTSLSQFVQQQREQGACQTNSADPFSINARFENTDSVTPENRGKCVDTSQERPIHVLSAKEVASLHMPAAGPGEKIVANFHYNHKFYIARFPADGVSEVVAQKEIFNPGVPVADQLNSLIGYSAHFQTRFEFNKPGKEVVLVPQDDPTNTSKAIRIHNVIASDEAVARVGGEGFDVVKGLHGHYAYARRLTGLQEKYEDMVVKKHHTVEQWRIKPVVNKNDLADGKTPTADLMRQQYFKSALELSERDYQTYKAGHTVMYDTLQRSCVTGGLEIFDRVNHYANPLQKDVEVLKRNPLLIRQMLFSRGMLYLQDYLPFHGQPDLKAEIESGKPFQW
jgi:hypothetical protein